MLVDGDGDLPGATEALGDDHEVAGGEFDELGALLGEDLHLSSQEVARLLRFEL